MKYTKTCPDGNGKGVQGHGAKQHERDSTERPQAEEAVTAAEAGTVVAGDGGVHPGQRDESAQRPGEVVRGGYVGVAKGTDAAPGILAGGAAHENEDADPGAEAARGASRDKATFTSRKLDWLNALATDRRFEKHPYDFKVGFYIAQCVNGGTGCAIVSDDTIADEIGGVPRSVRRARERLRARGWLTWKRRYSNSNVYKLQFTRLVEARDDKIMRREERAERRELARLEGGTKRTPESYRNRTPMSALHLHYNTKVKKLPTSKEEEASKEEKQAHSLVDRGGSSVPDGYCLGCGVVLDDADAAAGELFCIECHAAR